MLPFIVGIAAGATAVVAYNNRKEIKETVIEGADKAKELAKEVKESVGKKMECLTSKEKEQSEESSKKEEGK